MKITTSYFVIRSDLLKKFVCHSRYATQTKLLSAAQKFDTKSEAESALSEFVFKMEQKAHQETMDIGFKDESREEAHLQQELQKARSFKIFQAERIFELKGEVLP